MRGNQASDGLKRCLLKHSWQIGRRTHTLAAQVGALGLLSMLLLRLMALLPVREGFGESRGGGGGGVFL